MLRIKNGNDTTVVNFIMDEKGNVTEEEIVSKTGPEPKNVLLL